MEYNTLKKIFYTSPTRTPWHDYGNGSYLVFFEHSNYIPPAFGKIINNEVQLTNIGKYAATVIEKTPLHNPYCEILHYKIFPTTICIVLSINCNKVPYNRRIRRNSILLNTLQNSSSPTTLHTKTLMNIMNPEMKELSDCKGWLSVTIGNIKSEISKIAKRQDVSFSWKKSFDDHIIKNDAEMNFILERLFCLPKND